MTILAAMTQPSPHWPRRAGAICGMVLTLTLAACSSNKPPPAPLQPVVPRIDVALAWQQQVQGVSFVQQAAWVDGRIIVAGDDGVLRALDEASGTELWRAALGAKISAGVGSDGRYSAVATRDNDVVVLDGARERWRARVPSQVVTAPLVAGERVFVLGVDRAVYAFDALDGRRLWVLRRPADALTLAQPGVLSAYQDTLLVGQGSRLAGVDPLRGSVRWDVAVVSPRGTNEIERLADLIGPPVRTGARFCMRAFQNGIGCVDAERQALVWSQPAGGTQAVGGSEGWLIAADGAKRLSARSSADGQQRWLNESLQRRELSAPAVLGAFVVLGDAEGWLHFFALDDGAPQLRLATDGSRIVSLTAQGDRLLAITAKGGVRMYRLPLNLRLDVN